MLSRFDIQKLRDLPIEQVAEALQISVSRHKAICPFHNDTRPSLTFNNRRNRFRCFVCETNGSTIDLVMKSQGWTFYDSCRWLAKQFGVVLSEELGYFHERSLKQQVRKVKKELPPPPIDVHYLKGLMANPVLTEEAQRFLFDERKISPKVVKQIGISSISEPTPMSGNPNGSWFNAPSLLIPYRDVDGKLLSVQARYLGTDMNKPRFQFPKGSTCSIFNLPELKTLAEGEELWITEGVTDCLAIMSSGRNAIAIPSATLLSEQDKQMLKSFAEGLHKPSTINHKPLSFHMIPDNDTPGNKLFLELQKLLPSLEHHLLPSNCKDFGEYWKSVNAGANRMQ